MPLLAEPSSPSRGRGPRRLAAALLLPTALAGAALLPPAVASADTAPVTVGSLTRSFSDGALDWTVTAGVYTLTITAVGGSGANGVLGYDSPGGAGGRGTNVGEHVPVVPGELLHIEPGAAGSYSTGGVSSGALARGGNGSAGDSLGGRGGGGGAATVVRSDSAFLAVAGGGGGGGGGGSVNGWSGGSGGAAGADGANGSGPGGGAGGSGHAFDVGTNANAASSTGSAGGGGGGGGLDGKPATGIFFSGGGLAGRPGAGGGSGGGGAGGLSFAVDPAAYVGVASSPGDGSVTISWDTYLDTTTTLTPASLPSTLAFGTPITVTATVTPVRDTGPVQGSAVAFEVDYATTGASVIQPVPLVDGTASWTFTPTTLGDLTVRAGFLGTGTWDESISQPVSTFVVRAVPGLSASTNRLLFSDVVVGSAATQTLTLTNTGTVPWSAIDATSGAPAVSLDTSQCPSLAPGASCPITVAFAPTGAGQLTTAIAFSAGGVTATVGVAGTGVAATSTLVPSPSPVAFGNVPVGSLARRSVTLTNTGNATWATTGAGASNGIVALDATSCATVAPGAHCTATVTFAPTAAGPVSTTLTLLSASGTASIPVTGTATVAAKPVVTRISPAKGTHLGGTTVTITGRNFDGVTAIRIGGVLMTSVHCTSSTTCTAVTPRGTGTKAIRVTTAAGTSALVAADRYTYR